MNSREDEEFLLSGEKKVVQRPKQASKVDIKLVAFFAVGVVSSIYVVAELAAAIKLDSLVLLSDGFHNLSDVISLGIAYWARQAAKRNSDDSMSYGWARTEILGGLTNGCFLLSLVVYVMLESIPKLIKPVQLEDAMLFIIISASGLTVNLIGTIIFAITGQGHSHSHSHGGHSHGHDHGHKEKKDKKKKKIEHVDSMEMNSPVITVKETNNLVLLDDHVDETASPKKEKKEKKEGHGHSHGHGHAEGEKKEKKEKKEGHGHSHEHPEGEKKEKKEKKEGHGHSHDHGHAEGEKKEKKEKKEGHGHSHDHGHAEGEKKEKKEKKKGHGHSHDHGHDDHGHKEGGKKKEVRDENVHAVFLHFLGDAISSLMVLGAGLLLHFFKGGPWTAYIDPVSSLIISVLILYTTIPLIKRCSMVLLQHSGDINVNAIRKKIIKVEGLLSVHDLHIWQLVDGMTIASVHIAIEEGVDFTTIVSQVKKIFHKNGVHSTSIQPEFVPRNFQTGGFCVQNCVEDCGEDWCCKKSVDNLKALEEQYSIRAEM